MISCNEQVFRNEGTAQHAHPDDGDPQTIYAGLPQVREYVQYYLADRAGDDAEDPIDAIVRISFDSEATMREVLDTPEYRAAHELRSAFMRDTSIGIHSALLERGVQLV